jgi:hypothetical protein
VAGNLRELWQRCLGAHNRAQGLRQCRLVLEEIVVARVHVRWALSDVSWTSLSDPQLRRALPFAAVPALGLVWSLGLAWSLTRPQRIEPQTEVTLACDFSGDVSAFYERERHMYAFRNREFADALVQANRDRVWSSEDRMRSNKIQGILTAVGVVCLVVAAIIWLR